MPNYPKLLGDSGEYYFKNGIYYMGQLKNNQIDGLGIMVQKDRSF